MTTKPNDSKPSERIRQLLDEARDLCPEDTEAVVMSGAIVAYLDEQHAAGQGERPSTLQAAFDAGVEKGRAVSRVEGASEAKPIATDHRTPPRNPSAAFGSDDCKTCGGLRRVRKGDRGLWEICPECWAKDGAGHAEPTSPESLPHRAGLPLPIDADEPLSPVAGERKTQKVTLRDPKSADNTCDCFRDCSRCGRTPAGWFMLDGWPDAVMCCAECEPGEHDHAVDKRIDTLKSKLASVEAELQRAYESNSDNAKLLRASQSALAEANARAERLEALANRLILSASPETAAELGLQEGTGEPPARLYPNGPDLALQNPSGYVCWKCGAKPKPQTVLDPSQPEPVAVERRDSWLGRKIRHMPSGEETFVVDVDCDFIEVSPALELAVSGFGVIGTEPVSRLPRRVCELVADPPAQPVEGVAVGGERAIVVGSTADKIWQVLSRDADCDDGWEVNSLGPYTRAEADRLVEMWSISSSIYRFKTARIPIPPATPEPVTGEKKP